VDPSAAEDLISRLIDCVNRDNSEESSGTVTVSADSFLDVARWQRERQHYFFDTPQVIGFAGDVAQPNSYITAEAMGIPLLVARDQAGTLRAFVNACAHRGARVAEGCGSAQRLNCPFHGWSYRLDGSLAGRPGEASFDIDKAACHLQSLAVSERAGLLLVGLHNDVSAACVDAALDEIAPALHGFNFSSLQTLALRRFEVAANWKLVVALSLESYHFATLHRDSLAPLMTSHAVCDEFGRHARWAFPLRGIEQLAQQPRENWPSQPPAAISHVLFPGTVVIVNGAEAQIIRVEPGQTAASSVVYYSGGCADVTRRDAALQAYEFGGDIFQREDLPAAEQCQQGIAAARRDIIVGRNEPMVQWWLRRWREDLPD